MTDTQKKTALGAGIACALIGLGIYFFSPWFRPALRTPSSLTDKPTRQQSHPLTMAGWDGEQARQRLHRLNVAADSVGVDTTRYALAPSDSETVWQERMTGLLIELRYGHRPARYRHVGLPETPDTTGLQAMIDDETYQADWFKQAASRPYTQLVTAYQQQQQAEAPVDSLRAIRKTMNFYRYLNRFGADRIAIVNIPAAEMTVFAKNGERLVQMQVIVGKKSKRTPNFTAYLTAITMYPYWNVPRGIGLREILPKAQHNPNYLDGQNMQVLDSRDHPVEVNTLDWGSFSASNFPYRFRQASGCDNSLGLLKFTLTCPFDIYLHDTNARDLFVQTTNRWRSHGCVRLQKPVEFANFVLNEPRFDAAYMNRCLIDQKPKIIAVPKPFPVVVAYNTADVDSAGKLVFYPDVYGLTK